MNTAFKLPRHVSAEFDGQGKIVVMMEQRKQCICGGKLHIHSRIIKQVLHDYTMGGPIYLTVDDRGYRCIQCKKIVYDDYGLGISHYTTALFREGAVKFADATSLGVTAGLLDIPKSTLYNWVKKAGNRR
ncbi:hypothetical protein [Kurthia sibirica]|uniref:Transposase n=1 Tax=Kurthia sibirica TaxID=202750 RepID=A0A2U3AER0_9BACL|nr:hypothetical protein [Kurthia sibirica]PWI23029.1 hypothetical protein DEX24_16490 [Kurthia sibirica]GEK35552.1 hypothetical protein KSI01_30850 [Kurthia sibirica]